MTATSCSKPSGMRPRPKRGPATRCCASSTSWPSSRRCRRAGPGARPPPRGRSSTRAARSRCRRPGGAGDVAAGPPAGRAGAGARRQPGAAALRLRRHLQQPQRPRVACGPRPAPGRRRQVPRCRGRAGAWGVGAPCRSRTTLALTTSRTRPAASRASPALRRPTIPTPTAMSSWPAPSSRSRRRPTARPMFCCCATTTPRR